MVRGFLKRFRTIDSLYLTGYFTYSWRGKEQLAALLFFFASPPPLLISLFIHSSPEVFFHLFPSLKVYHHHHYHKIELARYSMTRSFHLSLSSIAIGSSSSLHPEGLFNGISINLIIFIAFHGAFSVIELVLVSLLSWVFPGRLKFPQTLLLFTVVSISIWL